MLMHPRGVVVFREKCRDILKIMRDESIVSKRLSPDAAEKSNRVV